VKCVILLGTCAEHAYTDLPWGRTPAVVPWLNGAVSSHCMSEYPARRTQKAPLVPSTPDYEFRLMGAII
jgi:hypothetical protein